MRKIILVAFVLGAGLAGYGLANYLYNPADSASPSYNTPVTHGVLTLPDLNGVSYPWQHWQGKLIVINFWATWCPPCREEIPEFIVLQERYKDEGLQIVGVAIDHPEAARHFSDSVGINYPVLLGEPGARQAMRDYGNASGSLPYTVVIDPSDRVVARKLGIYRYTDLETVLKPYLKTALPAKPV